MRRPRHRMCALVSGSGAGPVSSAGQGVHSAGRHGVNRCHGDMIAQMCVCIKCWCAGTNKAKIKMRLPCMSEAKAFIMARQKGVT